MNVEERQDRHERENRRLKARLGSCAAAVIAGLIVGCSGQHQSRPAPPEERAVHAQRAVPAEVTNRVLIAAMSDQAESVMVWRFAALREAGWGLAEMVQQGALSRDSAASADGFAAVIHAAIKEAHPVAWAHGGAAFTAPRDLGLGNYVEQSIWVTERPLTDLMRSLETGEGIGERFRRHDDGNVVIYEGPTEFPVYGSKPVQERLFVAFLDDKTVATAETRRDINQMLANIGTTDHQVPQRWAAAADGLDLDAPLVILRRYDPANRKDRFSPVSAAWPAADRIDIDSFGLVLEDARALVYRVNTVTRQPERAEAFFQEWYTPQGRSVGWRLERTQSGFAGTGATPQESRGAPESMFSLMLMFGWNMYI